MKTRNAMYVQEVDRLPYPVAELEERIEPQVKYLAYNIHDKDKNENGELVKPHIHFLVNFENPRSINAIAKLFGDDSERIESMSKYGSNGFNNSLSYLVHHTSGSTDKYQYDPEDVVANFDYVAKLNEIEKNVSEFKENSGMIIGEQIKSVFDKAGYGLMSINEAKEELLKISPLVLANNSSKIDKLFKDLVNIESDKWVEKMQDEQILKRLVWVYGDAGLGKTALAREELKKQFGKNVFISGSSNDRFQGYSGEHGIVLDELRPDTKIPYDDLLKMFDPHNYESMTNSRYSNSHLMAEVIYVTTPYSPFDFYTKLVGDIKGDKFSQLKRRIDKVVHITKKEIQILRYTNKFDDTNELIQAEEPKPNKYWEQALKEEKSLKDNFDEKGKTDDN